MDKEFKTKILKILKSSISGIQMGKLAEMPELIRHTVAKYLEILQAEGKIHYIQIDRTKLWKDISLTANIRLLKMADLDDSMKIEEKIEKDRELIQTHPKKNEQLPPEN